MMSTRSRRSMVGLAVVGGIATTVLVTVLVAHGQDPARPAIDQRSKSFDGRFQIVMRDDVRADTFLLDTQEGMVWQMTQYSDVEGQPVVWLIMNRLDTEADVLPFAIEALKGK